ncbi:hypothetical protein PFNF54_05588 [Plasmodium falciparum NF54]|uniref:Uncharacterized protein n=1 Tax=Plasmodium falciparum (isolate NF54) TaxID=5843 RepID=W7JXX6_PLAFO|nr:hypothetical protein PFNF54_05588 [Plasmodium falciparum NF54]
MYVYFFLFDRLKEDSLDLIEDNIEDEIEKGSDKKDKNNSNVSISEKENNEKGKKIDKEKIIHEWIKRTMKEWNEEIENIVDSKKKIKQATYLQTHKDLKPLEKKLKQKTKIYNKLNDTLDEKHKKNNADVENEETNIG